MVFFLGLSLCSLGMRLMLALWDESGSNLSISILLKPFEEHWCSLKVWNL